jgi:hypothetical protein
MVASMHNAVDQPLTPGRPKGDDDHRWSFTSPQQSNTRSCGLLTRDGAYARGRGVYEGQPTIATNDARRTDVRTAAPARRETR